MTNNIMSVDLEDYFCDLPINEWSKYKSRIRETTVPLLDMFENYNVKATFFVVGYFAEKFPDLIKLIHDKGHEIGTHTFSHIDLRKVSKDELVSDLEKSIIAIESITGEKVLGFRAPFFSITKKNSWVIDVLKNYFAYDSSIFPVKTQLYGLPNAPRLIYKPSLKNIIQEDKEGKLIEIPMATHKIPLIGNIPIAGGFYLRFFPYWYMKLGIKRMNKDGNPAMIYIHPKDLDPEMPKIKEYNWYYYYNLKSGMKKFENLLKDFKFGTVKDALEILK